MRVTNVGHSANITKTDFNRDDNVDVCSIKNPSSTLRGFRIHCYLCWCKSRSFKESFTFRCSTIALVHSNWLLKLLICVIAILIISATVAVNSHNRLFCSINTSSKCVNDMCLRQKYINDTSYNGTEDGKISFVRFHEISRRNNFLGRIYCIVEWYDINQHIQITFVARQPSREYIVFTRQGCIDTSIYHVSPNGRSRRKQRVQMKSYSSRIYKTDYKRKHHCKNDSLVTSLYWIRLVSFIIE